MMKDQTRLWEILSQYKAAMQEENTEKRDLQLSKLMTGMENEFGIPAMNTEAYNENHRDIMKLYRKISDSRDL